MILRFCQFVFGKDLVVWLFLLVLSMSGPTTTASQELEKIEHQVSVGAPGRVEQVKLPGTELKSKPIEDDRSPVIVRIIDTFPHGDAFRYDLVYQGLEPGIYDLTDYLVRKDGSTTDDLPPVRVQILSLLPPGQVEPNELQSSVLPRLGGYQILMWGALVFWGVVLLGLIFWRRGDRKEPETIERKLSLAELLRPRLEQAVNQELNEHQLAELERMLIAFWRRRLNLEDVNADQALKKIKADPEAGKLLTQVQRWLHRRNRANNVDLQELLKPYESISSEALASGEREAIQA